MAAPFLGIGLACKKIALIKDSKANQYHHFLKIAIKDGKLSRQIEELGHRHETAAKGRNIAITFTNKLQKHPAKEVAFFKRNKTALSERIKN